MCMHFWEQKRDALVVSIARLLVCMCVFGALTACGSKSSNSTGAAPDSAAGSESLTAAEVQQIIAQAARKATDLGLPVTIAVVDREGTRLGVLQMASAPTTTTISGGGSGGLEGQTLTDSAFFAAVSKAGTGAFLSSQGNAFSTRTASFIVQEHFPPQVVPSVGGPLFGVQFSQLLCSDVSRTSHSALTSNLPLGLSADPGGLPLYKNNVLVGGIGVEGDGIYTADKDPTDNDQPLEEIIASAGTVGFVPPNGIRADRILLDGIAFPFANVGPNPSSSSTPYSTFSAAGTERVAPIASPASGFTASTVGGVSGFVDSNFPFIAGTDGGLTAAEVTQILGQAAQQADRTRAAIRNPLGTPARVNITVVDTTGTILGIFRTLDAPLFGFDVSVQKARTANFFTHSQAGTELTAAGLTTYVAALAAEGINLDGQFAFTDRAGGFMSQPIFPPGATSSFSHGPLSLPLGQWSPFNTGLQLDAINLTNAAITPASPCTSLTRVANGFQIFPGSVPLFKNGVHVGAIGVSGDGVDQDDLIAAKGSEGFEAPEGIRADQLLVRGARLPYVVFPRNPNR